jgi:hypothetical protein
MGDKRTGGAGRSDAAKADWLCKHCPGFKNFGHRSSCFRCFVEKGKAFKPSPQPVSSPTTSKAERQVAESKRQDKAQAQRIRELEAKLRVAEKQKLPWGSKPQPVVVEEDEDDQPIGLGLEQLKRTKELYLTFGKSGEKDVERITADIAALQAATNAKKPGSDIVRRAEQRVRRANAACAAGLAKQLVLEKELVDLAAAKTVDDQELADAEAAHLGAIKALQLQKGVDAPTQAVPLSAGFEEMFAGMLDADFQSSGFTRDQLQSLGRWTKAREAAVEQRRKDAAVVAAAEAAAAAQEVARVEAAKVQQAAVPGSVAGAAGAVASPAADVGHAADMDAFMADVSTLFAAELDAANVDAEVKRGMEAKLGEMAKKRKLRKAPY